MTTPVSTGTPRQNLRSTYILFIAIVIGIFLFMLIAVLIGQTRGPLQPSLNEHYRLLSGGMAALSFICLIAAKSVFNKGLLTAKNSLNPLNDKLAQHRNALIKYLFICEVPVMLSIILYLLTGYFVFEVYAGVFLGFMLTMLPVKRRVIEQLELSAAEQQELAGDSRLT